MKQFSMAIRSYVRGWVRMITIWQLMMVMGAFSLLPGSGIHAQTPPPGTWTKRINTAEIPVAVEPCLFFYDAKRQQGVLFRDYAPITTAWTWAAPYWRKAPFAPDFYSNQYAHAYDPDRGCMVLFGGVQMVWVSWPLPGHYEYYANNQTHEWNGATWAQRTAALAPPAMYGAAMAYDGARKQIVLFGGRLTTNNTMLNQTWIWNGSVWQQRTPTHTPPSRAGHGMAYDRTRKRIVLWGGYSLDGGEHLLNDTWEWNGTDWIARTPATVPSKRYYFGLEYDAGRQRTVLVGGCLNSMDPSGTGLKDTWEWDGANWKQAGAATLPGTLAKMQIAYDESERRLVIFGGHQEKGGFSDDISYWDGRMWNSYLVGGSPTLMMHASAYRKANRTTLLFGGREENTGRYVNKTYEWDGSSMSLLTPPSSPPGRAMHAMAYDSKRDRVVLFGGAGYNINRFADSWEWNGTTWLQRTPQHAPPGLIWHSMAYDANRGRVVLFGGCDPQVTNATWEWDGTDWVQRTPAHLPPARNSQAMAYDQARKKVVMFGGLSDWGGGTHLLDTWEWDGTDWTKRTPAHAPADFVVLGLGMAYDECHQKSILFTGQETWVWDGTDWTRLAISQPGSREGTTLAFDSQRDCIILHGGRTPSSPSTQYSDLWELRLFRNGVADWRGYR